MKKCPWKDYKGNDIFEGDIIRHPVSGVTGEVVFLSKHDHVGAQWRVDYKDGDNLSRLCLQIGEKGQAEVINSVDSKQ